VQGSEAPAQIADMVRAANRFHADSAPLDLVLVARGGGSIEDLWAFNDERVAYAIFESHLPVITGIGHETDFTIADFVADLRAPTPSAAAAMVTPDQKEIRSQLASAVEWMSEQVGMLVMGERREMVAMEQRLRRLHPQRGMDLRRQQLDERERRMHLTMQQRLTRLHDRTGAAEQQLQALNPQRVLARGYSIVQHGDGRVVYGPAEVAANEQLSVHASHGTYAVTVTR
jgi:exodeoxyribonuclease VII large subunit